MSLSAVAGKVRWWGKTLGLMNNVSVKGPWELCNSTTWPTWPQSAVSEAFSEEQEVFYQ